MRRGGLLADEGTIADPFNENHGNNSRVALKLWSASKGHGQQFSSGVLSVLEATNKLYGAEAEMEVVSEGVVSDTWEIIWSYFQVDQVQYRDV